MGKTPVARAAGKGRAQRRGMKKEATAASGTYAVDDRVGTCRICTVANTNDWYLTTDQGIPLGPYGSREEAEATLALLRRRADSGPTGAD